MTKWDFHLNGWSIYGAASRIERRDRILKFISKNVFFNIRNLNFREMFKINSISHAIVKIDHMNKCATESS